MKVAHKYAWGSVLVAALGIGFVVYLYRRKPVITVSGIIEAGDPTVTYHSAYTPKDVPESDVERMIRISNATIAADDAAQ